MNTGKLIYREADGKGTTFTDPITDEKFESCYEKDATFRDRLNPYLDTANSLPLRTCRSILCGLHLFPQKEVYTLFGQESKEIQSTFHKMVMHRIRYGLVNLSDYSAE